MNQFLFQICYPRIFRQFSVLFILLFVTIIIPMIFFVPIKKNWVLVECCITLPFFKNLAKFLHGQYWPLIALLWNKLLCNITGKRNVHCAMIGLSKAFEEINRDVMIDKLLQSSLRTNNSWTIGYVESTFAEGRYKNGK